MNNSILFLMTLTADDENIKTTYQFNCTLCTQPGRTPKSQKRTHHQPIREQDVWYPSGSVRYCSAPRKKTYHNRQPSEKGCRKTTNCNSIIHNLIDQRLYLKSNHYAKHVGEAGIWGRGERERLLCVTRIRNKHSEEAILIETLSSWGPVSSFVLHPRWSQEVWVWVAVPSVFSLITACFWRSVGS